MYIGLTTLIWNTSRHTNNLPIRAQLSFPHTILSNLFFQTAAARDRGLRLSAQVGLIRGSTHLNRFTWAGTSFHQHRRSPGACWGIAQGLPACWATLLGHGCQRWRSTQNLFRMWGRQTRAVIVVTTEKSWSRRNPDSRRFVLMLPVAPPTHCGW